MVKLAMNNKFWLTLILKITKGGVEHTAREIVEGHRQRILPKLAAVSGTSRHFNNESRKLA